MSTTNDVAVTSTGWTQIATAQEDFILQNPEANNMLYVRNSATDPGAGVVGGKRVKPYDFYGREDAANSVLEQGIVWTRADKDMVIPVDK